MPELVQRSELSEFVVGEVVTGTSYRIIGSLGAGGMGTVWLVENTALSRLCVLKTLCEERRSNRLDAERMLNEARALGVLKHPNVVHIDDVRTTVEGTPYLVMEYIDGESLDKVLRREQKLELRRALTIASDVASGLAEAHSRDIVHRDIKPANIMIAKDGCAKILDFGAAKLAKPARRNLTKRGMVLGTPRYMSPEQAQGIKVDGRADLYSLGVVLYQMICGRLPFEFGVVIDGADTPDLLKIPQLRTPPTPPSRWVPKLDLHVEELLMWLLEPNPAHRVPTAETMLRLLRPCLDGEVAVTDSEKRPRGLGRAVPATRSTGVSLRGEPHGEGYEVATVQAIMGRGGWASDSAEPSSTQLTAVVEVQPFLDGDEPSEDAPTELFRAHDAATKVFCGEQPTRTMRPGSYLKDVSLGTALELAVPQDAPARPASASARAGLATLDLRGAEGGLRRRLRLEGPAPRGASGGPWVGSTEVTLSRRLFATAGLLGGKLASPLSWLRRRAQVPLVVLVCVLVGWELRGGAAGQGVISRWLEAGRPTAELRSLLIPDGGLALRLPEHHWQPLRIEVTWAQVPAMEPMSRSVPQGARPSGVPVTSTRGVAGARTGRRVPGWLSHSVQSDRDTVGF